MPHLVPKLSLSRSECLAYFVGVRSAGRFIQFERIPKGMRVADAIARGLRRQKQRAEPSYGVTIEAIVLGYSNIGKSAKFQDMAMAYDTTAA